MTDDCNGRGLLYASTPLRALALSEISARLLDEPAVQKTLSRNLDALEHAIPSSCTDLDSAHEYFDDAVFMSVCAAFSIADSFDSDFRSRGERMPLLLKISLALMSNPGLGRAESWPDHA